MNFKISGWISKYLAVENLIPSKTEKIATTPRYVRFQVIPRAQICLRFDHFIQNYYLLCKHPQQEQASAVAQRRPEALCYKI